MLAVALGVPARLEWADLQRAEALSSVPFDPENDNAPPQLRLPLLSAETTGAEADAGLALIVLPAKGERRQGLALLPFAEGALAEEIELDLLGIWRLAHQGDVRSPGWRGDRRAAWRRPARGHGHRRRRRGGERDAGGWRRARSVGGTVDARQLRRRLRVVRHRHRRAGGGAARRREGARAAARSRGEERAAARAHGRGRRLPAIGGSRSRSHLRRRRRLLERPRCVLRRRLLARDQPRGGSADWPDPHPSRGAGPAAAGGRRAAGDGRGHRPRRRAVDRPGDCRRRRDRRARQRAPAPGRQPRAARLGVSFKPPNGLGLVDRRGAGHRRRLPAFDPSAAQYAGAMQLALGHRGQGGRAPDDAPARRPARVTRCW